MKKFAIALIIIAALFILGANWFLNSLDGGPQPEAPPVADNTTLRSTTSGNVVGFIDNFGARAWMGVPFAAAPVGDKRWRAPEPPTPWTDTKQALAAGAMCPQFASLLSGAGEDAPQGEIAGDEDCLYLNVWSPPNAKDLPVMLWIHGGGNTIGHGGSYIGARLAVDQRVVLVTINYRLGVFGWFNHESLSNGDPADSSGNYGTLDAIRALEWTRDNIETFGGDPGNVTVFGESAGGGNTLSMLASPLAKGLFHRAIVQSGGYGTTALDRGRNWQSAGGHEHSSNEILALLRVADDSAGDVDAARKQVDALSRQETREYLYSKTPEEFFAIFDGAGFGMINLPRHYADGTVLPDIPTTELFSDASKYNTVPIILGTNRDEPALFMVRDPRWVSNFLGFLPRLRDEEAYLRAVNYGALAWKVRGVDHLARLMTASGNQDVYTYRFDWDELPSIMGYDLATALGAAHGLEIAFAFGEFEEGMNLGYLYNDSADKDSLAKAMMSYWADFARNGDPGDANGIEAWQPFSPNGLSYLRLDLPVEAIGMADEHVSNESVKAQLAADASVSDQEERCRLYASNFRWEHFDQAEYESFGEHGCSEFPAESFGR